MPNTNNQITTELRKLLTTDKAHADIFNTLFQTLIGNDNILDDKLTNTIQKEQIIHDTEESDKDKIPSAEVTAALQNQINDMNIYIALLKDMLKHKKSFTADKSSNGFLIKTHNIENTGELLKITMVRNGNKFWYGTIGFTTIKEMVESYCTATKNSAVGMTSTVSFFNYEGYAYIHISADQWTNLLVESTTRSIHSIENAPIPSGVNVIKAIQIS